MGGKLYCPYCYRPFTEKQIMFRCAGRPTPTGKKCEKSTDRVLENRMHDNDKYFPAFAADGRRNEAICPKCKDPTNYKICPECHSQLPVQFGKVDSRLIALIGAKDSGKTVYMTVLLHEMMHRVGRQFGAAVLGADDSTRERFGAEYEDLLYEKQEVHRPTRTAAADEARGGRRPLVFTFSVGQSRTGRSRVQRSLLSYFDTAGEDLTHAESVDQNARYLTSADGIILLLDPLQMKGARPLADERAVLPDRADGEDSPENVLGRVTDLLTRTLDVSHKKKITKPLAVAFSKMDALEASLGAASPILNERAAEPYFDEPDSLAVHAHVQDLLYRWQGGNLDDALTNHYANYRLFGFSALGDSPIDSGGGQRISDRGIRPYRVEDPFLWLLSEFGTIPKSRKAAGGG